MTFDEWADENGVSDPGAEFRESYREAWDAGAAESAKLRLIAAHFAAALHRVQTRPANESAFIAAVALDDAKKTFGYEIV